MGIWQIYARDLSNGTEFRVNPSDADQIRPDIDGNRIVWESDYSIEGFDLGAGEAFTVFTSDGSAYAHRPAISGDVVVWMQQTVGVPDSLDIYGATIPEPATLSLMAVGGLAMVRRRKREMGK
jgi:beta propeller repeat protein